MILCLILLKGVVVVGGLAQCRTMMVQYPVPSISPWVSPRLVLPSLPWLGLRRVPDCPSQSWRGRALLNTESPEMIRAYKHFRKKLAFIKHESKIWSQLSGLEIPIQVNFLFRTDWGQRPGSNCGRSNFLREISGELLRYKQGWGWDNQRGHQINCVHG